MPAPERPSLLWTTSPELVGATHPWCPITRYTPGVSRRRGLTWLTLPVPDYFVYSAQPRFRAQLPIINIMARQASGARLPLRYANPKTEIKDTM